MMYVKSSVQEYVAKNLSLSEQSTLRLLAYLKMSRCDLGLILLVFKDFKTKDWKSTVSQSFI